LDSLWYSHSALTQPPKRLAKKRRKVLNYILSDKKVILIMYILMYSLTCRCLCQSFGNARFGYTFIYLFGVKTLLICGKTFGKRQLERARNTREVDGLSSTECLLTIYGSSYQRVRNITWRHNDHSFVCGYLQGTKLNIRLRFQGPSNFPCDR
jgi:hypothetical protein